MGQHQHYPPPDIDEMRAKREVKGLIRALRYQKNVDIQANAAEALGEIGDTIAVEPLIAALKDNYWGVRKYAAKALGKIGDTHAVEPLIVAVMDLNKDVSKNAIEALGRIGDARAVGSLISTFKDLNTAVRKNATEALVKIGSPAVESLSAALEDSDGYVRIHAAKALCIIGDARAVEPLIAVLKNSSGELHQRIADALGKIGDARAVEPLIAVLNDRNWLDRKAAAKALISLYQRYKLDNQAKQQILALRTNIEEPHSDESSWGCEGMFPTSHGDRDIGVEFPL
jgi:HEAT repeat protein